MATWLWQKSVSREHESLWQERLAALPGLVFSEGFNASRLSISVYTDNLEEALVLEACYGGKSELLEETDWVAASAPRHLPPLRIRNRLLISSSEDPDELARLREQYPGRIVLSFPPEMAFGTGNHATTSSCLRLLCDYARAHKQKPWTLTDIGCGTGVLALAGLRLGARSAISFDFDAKAVEVATRNIARNGGGEQLRLFQADVFEWAPAPGEEADLVLANLFSGVLQKAFPRLTAAMKPDGVLIISGILNSQAEETLRAAENAGLCVDKVVRRGKWTTAQLHRS